MSASVTLQNSVIIFGGKIAGVGSTKGLTTIGKVILWPTTCIDLW